MQYQFEHLKILLPVHKVYFVYCVWIAEQTANNYVYKIR